MSILSTSTFFLLFFFLPDGHRSREIFKAPNRRERVGFGNFDLRSPKLPTGHIGLAEILASVGGPGRDVVDDGLKLQTSV